VESWADGAGGMRRNSFYYPGAATLVGDVVLFRGEIWKVDSILYAESRVPGPTAVAATSGDVAVYTEGSRPQGTVMLTRRDSGGAKPTPVVVYGADWASVELAGRHGLSEFAGCNPGAARCTYYYAGEPIRMGDLLREAVGTNDVSRVVGLHLPGDPAAGAGDDHDHGVIWLRILVGRSEMRAEATAEFRGSHAIDPFSYLWEDLELIQHRRRAPT
jgi:hypothetical protein